MSDFTIDAMLDANLAASRDTFADGRLRDTTSDDRLQETPTAALQAAETPGIQRTAELGRNILVRTVDNSPYDWALEEDA